MTNTHLSLVGIHLSLVGSVLIIEARLAGFDPGALSYIMLIGGLFITLFSLFNRLSPAPTSSDT
ncbi:hypothetical protein C482_10756 [Natrialba chahannaoensis JCM 10990]|uniref:Uncharacterized protein n=1 Tax=Natrialba chahannaoensis JCM 10990 TaxID=1227492 RepID=M0AL44_9EURY|nr:hypothetical protein [Natrialba chahannaoensis]ELY99031.1 hypothetical protein C482_10756 [Natrialba chahannaoensis JCM 10990]